MRRQPKYHFFKNTTYALNGLKDLIITEKSFKIELVVFVALLPVLLFIDVSTPERLLMFIALFGVLVAEAINSAIERVVDLATLEHHEMAGRAKDMGSAVVFLSIFACVAVWVVILYHHC